MSLESGRGEVTGGGAEAVPSQQQNIPPLSSVLSVPSVVSLPSEGRASGPEVIARLRAQLTQVEWEVESDKAIRVHKRGLDGRSPSPDLADALALAIDAKNWYLGRDLWI